MEHKLKSEYSVVNEIQSLSFATFFQSYDWGSSLTFIFTWDESRGNSRNFFVCFYRLVMTCSLENSTNRWETTKNLPLVIRMIFFSMSLIPSILQSRPKQTKTMSQSIDHRGTEREKVSVAATQRDLRGLRLKVVLKLLLMRRPSPPTSKPRARPLLILLAFSFLPQYFEGWTHVCKSTSASKGLRHTKYFVLHN